MLMMSVSVSAAIVGILLLVPNLSRSTAEPVRATASSSNPFVKNPIFNVNQQYGRWDSTGKYKFMDRAHVGSRFEELSKNFTVCLATQSSLDRLHSFIQVAQHWTGPISVAVFAAGDDELRILRGYVDFLGRCFAPIIERVSFHLAFPKDALPVASSYVDTSELDCRDPKGALHKLLDSRSKESAMWHLERPYPQNHMRNFARRNCRSPQIFSIDVDVIPSLNLAEDLNTFFKTENCTGLCAYVIPTYELDDRQQFPRNKTVLLRLVGRKLAWPFHWMVQIYNQFATNFSLWDKDLNNTIHVSHDVTNYEMGYEPFYVANASVPPFDEHFVGYGFTRTSQVFEMVAAGYRFHVLSPVFSIHWGLIRNRINSLRRGSHQFHMNSFGPLALEKRVIWHRRMIQNDINRRIFDRIFKPYVRAKYNRLPPI